MAWNKRKPLESYTDQDWISAAMYCSKNEYNRMRRIAVRSGIVEGGGVHAIKLGSVSVTDQFLRAQDGDRMTQFNKELEKWQTITIGALRQNMLRMGIKRGELYDSLAPTRKKNQFGEINRIGFSFARHGIFISKGAYAGFGGVKGSSWSYRKKTKNGYINTYDMRKTSTESLGKLMDSQMKDRDWFNSVIERRMERLAEICLAYHDQMIIDATNIYIKQ